MQRHRASDAAAELAAAAGLPALTEDEHELVNELGERVWELVRAQLPEELAIAELWLRVTRAGAEDLDGCQ